MKTWKIVLGMLTFWLLTMVYMSTMILQPSEGSSGLERQLKRTMRELEKLKAQNDEFRALADDIKNLNKDNSPVAGANANSDSASQNREIRQLKDKLRLMTQKLEEANNMGNKEVGPVRDVIHTSDKEGEPSLAHEKIRHKIDNDAAELWYYLRSNLNKLKEKASGNTQLVSGLSSVMDDVFGYHKTLTSDLWKLRTVDGMEAWRKKEAKDLGDLVQKRLHYLQNPKDCSKAKKISCNLSKGCGYGCQLHHVTYCLMVAYATQRTLILESKGWRYASAGWETVFQPLSTTCTDKSGSSSHHWAGENSVKDVQVVDLPIIDSLHPRPEYLPLSIPLDLSDRLIRLHGDPSVWWIGQFVKYLTRPQPHLKEDLERARQKLKFANPCVGVHVRRTDKLIAEASFHGITEYMTYVEEYYNKLELREPVPVRRVFLASDDPSVLAEAKKKYPHYEFISDPQATLSADLNKRYSDESLRGVVLDIHFLSLSDHLVCTFSSQVCRVAYEIMQTMHGDASSYFKSLDDIYYFGGQNGHHMDVLEKHVKRGGGEIDMEPGDVVGIAGNHWDGYSKGVNKRTGKTGLFPSYKTQNKLVIVDLPTYPEAGHS